MSDLLAQLACTVAALPSRFLPRPGDDRGDVPGWVLITVMTAGLVSALWLIADDQLARIFEGALSSVTGP